MIKGIILKTDCGNCKWKSPDTCRECQNKEAMPERGAFSNISINTQLTETGGVSPRFL